MVGETFPSLFSPFGVLHSPPFFFPSNNCILYVPLGFFGLTKSFSLKRLCPDFSLGSCQFASHRYCPLPEWQSVHTRRVKYLLHPWLVALLQWPWSLIPRQRHFPLPVRLRMKILVFSVIGGADIHSMLLENSRATSKMQMQSLLGYVPVLFADKSPSHSLSDAILGRTLPC